MPKLILTSKDAIWNKDAGAPYKGVVEALKSAHSLGCQTFVVSNHKKPVWLDESLNFLTFQECGFRPPRQSGKIIQELLEANEGKLLPSDIFILGADDEDMMMAVNSKTVLIRCEWAKPLGPKISDYGVPFSDPGAIPLVVKLLEGREPWYFIHTGDFMTVYALTSAGTKFEADATMVKLVNALRGCLKNGSEEYHKGFVLHFLSSIYATDAFKEVDVWGYYPSSASSNDESEVMADFCTLARETYKHRSHGPLFIRHTASAKRHMVGGDRTDCTSQLASVHLNPSYRGRLEGKTVAVLDDYLTYGVSFGVASALLKKAGAARVLAVSMGKFGDCAKNYAIRIQDDDVYSPLKKFSTKVIGDLSGDYTREAQTKFLNKFSDFV